MLSFENTRIAFQDKSSWELCKALWMFRFIGSPRLVQAGAAVLRTAIALNLPVEILLKPTVFNHFCAGERIAECDDTMARLGKYHIQTILDYSAEGQATESDLDATRDQVLAIIAKAKTNPHISHAVFKISGLAQFDLLVKAQRRDHLTEAEKRSLESAKQRVQAICDAAAQAGTPVMIDAEESWIQEIVDELAEAMILQYNTQRPLIYNTIQLYRHDRLDALKAFAHKAHKQGLYPAFKLVRGAYMRAEFARSQKYGTPSPLHASKAATDADFDAAVDFCLKHADTIGLCIGTHNEQSCARAVAAMETYSIAPDHPHVRFAQLLGMSDHISYNLAAHGYNVSKYAPCGPVKTVVPYLIRRAEENTAVMGQSSRELFLLTQEARRRQSGRRS